MKTHASLVLVTAIALSSLTLAQDKPFDSIGGAGAAILAQDKPSPRFYPDDPIWRVAQNALYHIAPDRSGADYHNSLKQAVTSAVLSGAVTGPGAGPVTLPIPGAGGDPPPAISPAHVTARAARSSHLPISLTKVKRPGSSRAARLSFSAFRPVTRTVLPARR